MQTSAEKPIFMRKENYVYSAISISDIAIWICFSFVFCLSNRYSFNL